jgi:hypothetical protein
MRFVLLCACRDGAVREPVTLAGQSAPPIIRAAPCRRPLATGRPRTWGGQALPSNAFGRFSHLRLEVPVDSGEDVEVHGSQRPRPDTNDGEDVEGHRYKWN